MRTFPGIRLEVFKDFAEREQIKIIADMLRQVSGGLSASIEPGQSPLPTAPSLPSLIDYLYLPGRPSGQRATGGTASVDRLALYDNQVSKSGSAGTGSIDLVGNSTRVARAATGASVAPVFEVGNTVDGTYSGNLAYFLVDSDGQVRINNSTSFAMSYWTGSTFAGVFNVTASTGDAVFGNTALSTSLGSITLDMNGLATYQPAIKASNLNGSLGATLGLTAGQTAVSASGIVRVFHTDNLASPTLVVNGNAAATARIVEFNSSANVNLSYIAADGSFNGPMTPSALTVTDNAFSILDDVTPTKIAKFQCATLAAGTNTFTFPATTAGTFAMINLAQTFTRGQTIQPSVDEPHFVINESGAGATGSFIEINAPSSVGGPVFRVSAGSGNPFYTEMVGWEMWCGGLPIDDPGAFKITFKNTIDPITANREIQWPNTNGTVLIRAAGPVNVAPRATLTSGTAAGATPGLYQINGYLYCTVTGTATVGLTVTFTDTVPKTVSVASLILGSTTQTQSGVIDVYVTSTSNITYNISYTGGGTGTYGARIRVTKLG